MTQLICSVQLLKAAVRFTTQDRHPMSCVYVTPDWVVATDGIALLALHNNHGSLLPSFKDFLEADVDDGIYLDPETIKVVAYVFNNNEWSGNEWPTFTTLPLDVKVRVTQGEKLVEVPNVDNIKLPDFSAILREIAAYEPVEQEEAMLTVKQLVRVGELCGTLYGANDSQGIVFHTKRARPCLLTLPDYGYLIVMPTKGRG